MGFRCEICEREYATAKELEDCEAEHRWDMGYNHQGEPMEEIE